MASRASRGDGGGDGDGGKLLGRFDWHSSSRVPTDGQTDTPRIHLDRHDFTMTEETPNKISISGTLPSRSIHVVSEDGMRELFATVSPLPPLR